jgi:hypothetical protein
MPVSPDDADELLGLLSHGWDKEFHPADLEAIEAFVQKHGAPACDLLVEYSRLHSELGAIVASSRAYDRAISGIADVVAGGPMRNSEVGGGRAQVVPPRRAPQRGWLGWAAAVSLLFAIVFSLRPKGTSQQAPPPLAPRLEAATLLRPPQPVACVSSVTDAVWEQAGAYPVGRTLYQKQRLHLLQGTAQISMACGADIVLQAPCVVKLAADDLVVLEQGKLTAQAAKWATGFVVETKGLRITDLGTRFAVSADSSGAAEAHVLEGEVLAEPMKEHRPKRSSMLLSAGEAIRVSHASINLIDAQRTRFVDHLSMFRPLRPIQIWNTGVGREIGKSDPHWRLTAGDTAYGPYPRAATITPGDPAYLDNMPEASQWISVHDQVYPGIPAESVHTFETTFDLTGYDLETVHIVGLFLVDDAINELRINGRPVPFKRWVTTWDVYDFKSFHPIEIVDGFVPSKNVISIDVYNSPSRPEDPAHPNPMSFRVEWQAFGCLSN